MATRPPSKRARSSIHSACESCRSRKVSCDGARPCSRCRLESRACNEPDAPERTPLTRQRMTELEQRLAAYEETWNVLHPSVSLDSARSILANGGSPFATQQLSTGMPQEPNGYAHVDGPSKAPEDGLETYPPTRAASPRAVSLRLLRDMPSASRGQLDKWAEDGSMSDPSPRDADAAVPSNDYGTGVRGGVGYIGLASAATLLRAIQKFAPVSHEQPDQQLAYRSQEWSGGPALPAAPSELLPRTISTAVHEPIRLPPAGETAPLVETYFSYFHALHPLVHEPTIRAQLAGALPLPGNASNHVLINMIFATGAFDSASDDNDANNGTKYYGLARFHLQQDLFAAGSIVLVQGLAIMAIYLQRCNRPNAGYVCLGLAVRMAMSLGLHVSLEDETTTGVSVLESETRNRVWWCLVAIEAGMSMTYGRPHGIALGSLTTARLPVNVDDENLTVSTTVKPADAPHVTRYTALIIQAKLARLAFRCLDRVTRSLPMPSVEQIRWSGAYFRDQMPTIDAISAPPAYRLACAVQSWRARYYRSVLYRPVFLSAAWSHGTHATSDPAVREIIENCRALAADNLNDIAEFVNENPGKKRSDEWYPVFFATQASLTLLLSIVWEPYDPRAPEWKAIITRTIDWFYRLSSMRELGTAYGKIMETVLSRDSAGPEMNGIHARLPQPEHMDFEPFNFDRYFAEIWDGSTQMVGIPGDLCLNEGFELSAGWNDGPGEYEV